MAEEQLGTKAYYVRAGMFKDVDVVLFAHVAGNFGVSYGAGRESERPGLGRVPVQRRERARGGRSLARHAARWTRWN